MQKKVSQVVVTQTETFLWKVTIFSRDRTERVEFFDDPDAACYFMGEVIRLSPWDLIPDICEETERRREVA